MWSPNSSGADPAAWPRPDQATVIGTVMGAAPDSPPRRIECPARAILDHAMPTNAIFEGVALAIPALSPHGPQANRLFHPDDS